MIVMSVESVYTISKIKNFVAVAVGSGHQGYTTCNSNIVYLLLLLSEYLSHMSFIWLLFYHIIATVWLILWCRCYGYPCPPFKIIILDDANSMTEDAQATLSPYFFFNFIIIWQWYTSSNISILFLCCRMPCVIQWKPTLIQMGNTSTKSSQTKSNAGILKPLLEENMNTIV